MAEFRRIHAGWMDAARDPTTHTQVPTASKFPGGFKSMIDHIHGLPMKLGLYTAMGVQTCGKFAASCGHEALDAKTYAGALPGVLPGAGSLRRSLYKLARCSVSGRLTSDAVGHPSQDGAPTS
eukprot:SAG11_NODE_294_length_11142_cov_7.050439_10_plen_123_part_00